MTGVQTCALPISFGFELELPPAPSEASGLFPSDEADPHVEAIVTTLQLLDEAATDDEDAISDLIAETHPRAATKIREFAEVLAKDDALFAVAFRDKKVRFDTKEQVRRVVESLRDTDISQADETHKGTLQGFLPEAREFEARLADGKLVKGRVDRTVSDIATFKQRWENVEATLSFRVVRVRTRSRYILTGAHAPTENGTNGAVEPEETP